MKHIGPPRPALRSARLLDQVRERIRYLHYSIRTEQAYVHWIRAFVRFHELKRHPSEMGAPEGLRLRVKDVAFERRAIVVREGKGAFQARTPSALYALP